MFWTLGAKPLNNSTQETKATLFDRVCRSKWSDPFWGYALLLAGLYVALFLPIFSAIDDAFITFRYAHNLADHGEFVLNLGERVEGVTNLLWAVILAVGHKLAREPVDLFAMHLTFVLLAICLWRVFAIGRLLGLSHVHSALGSLFIFANPHFLGAMANGLEGSLYSVLLAEMIYRYLRGHTLPLFITPGLLVWARPDGIVPVLLMAVLALRDRRSRRNLVLGLCIVGGMILGITVFRLVYFGDFVPNSVVAKSFSPALIPDMKGNIVTYLFSFARDNPLTILVLVSLIALVFRSRPRLRDNVGSVAFFALACIGYSFLVVIRNGGDWMPNFRLLLQYGVLYSVALHLLLRTRMLSVPVVVSLLVAQGAVFLASLDPKGVSPSRISVVERPHAREDVTNFWKEVTTRIGPVLEPNDVVSAEALGYISYTLHEFTFHDPLGLTDRYIARHGKPAATFGKHDTEYTLGHIRPSVLGWHYAGHLRGVDQSLLDRYTSYCPIDDKSWDTDLVMIRNDRLEDIGGAFADWRKVRVTSEAILSGGE